MYYEYELCINANGNGETILNTYDHMWQAEKASKELVDQLWWINKYEVNYDPRNDRQQRWLVKTYNADPVD